MPWHPVPIRSGSFGRSIRDRTDEHDKTLSFTILPGTTGEFSLQQVVGGLRFPVADGDGSRRTDLCERAGYGQYTRRHTNRHASLELQAMPFATLPVVIEDEKGLLGITVDPNFSPNGFVYVFYTASGPVNRVVRFTAVTS